MIYSAGWCPICGDGGDLFFLKNISSETVFFACDACGCAWKESPDIEENWDVLEPIKIAPDGFSLASASDIGKMQAFRILFSELIQITIIIFNILMGLFRQLIYKSKKKIKHLSN